MRYDEFRERWEQALLGAGLLFHGDRATETIDAATTDRHCAVVVGHTLPQRAAPFHVTAALSFRWGPFESARSYTTEEDLLWDLFGRHGTLPKTIPRWLRVDITLRATLPHDSTIPMPDPKVWGPWSASVDASLAKLLPRQAEERKGRTVAVTGWRGEIELQVRCASDSRLLLDRLQVAAWQAVNPPRVWDDPERREKEGGVSEQLADLADRFKGAFEAWMTCVSDLRRWL